ncbi:MAG: hypothetical protein NT136_03145 [Candidatus Moranbacteria bacterium]|nr:hypothetical protein [Candidatus Moranbacteria bacterium]
MRVKIIGFNTMESKNTLSKKKKDLYFELALFLILGFLLGVVIKTEAIKRITVGFYDYKISSLRQSYDISQIQKNLAAEAEAGQQSNSSQAGNGSCGQ